MYNLRKKIRKIPYLTTLKKISRKNRCTLWLIGGFLRDIYLERKDLLLDFDFSVEGNVLKIAMEFSKTVGGRFIVLDDKENTFRVVVKKKNIYSYDFSPLKGKDLKEDVLNRDFTINTLALNVNELPKVYVVDYLGAKDDLRKRILRVTREEVLPSDPLRILRAFSLSSKYNLKIEKNTKNFLYKYRRLIKNVSGERINEEIFKILDNLYSYRTIKLMSKLYIIDEVIPYVKKMRGVNQGKYHHLDVWEHSLETLFRFELLYRRRLVKNEDILKYLDEELASGRKRIHILKLACLLHDVGKPYARKIKDKKTIFHTHEKIGRDICEDIAARLKLSSKEKDVLKKLVFWHLRPGYLAGEVYPTKRAIFRFFRDTNQEGLALILLSIADWRATRGELVDRKKRIKHERVMFKLIEEYFCQKRQKPLPKIVDGFEIMKRFNLSPSPLVGKILNKIKEEQVLGKVKTKDDAYRVAKRLLQKGGRG